VEQHRKVDTDSGQGMPLAHQKGALRQILEAATNHQFSLKELAVLSEDLDPYRRDTPRGHRHGEWFAEVVATLLEENEQVHLRGLYYRLVASTNIARPHTGEIYSGTNEQWDWLADEAAKDARWLGDVPFERIIAGSNPCETR
jgi:hypothetical protein